MKGVRQWMEPFFTYPGRALKTNSDHSQFQTSYRSPLVLAENFEPAAQKEIPFTKTRYGLWG